MASVRQPSFWFGPYPALPEAMESQAGIGNTQASEDIFDAPAIHTS
jgi:hypothetical protein